MMRDFVLVNEGAGRFSICLDFNVRRTVIVFIVCTAVYKVS